MTWRVVQTVRADARELNAGTTHLTNPDGFQSGRLRRSPGQTLCGAKPFDFHAARGPLRCPRCIAHARAHGINLRVNTGAALGDKCDKCDEPAVAFYAIAISLREGEADMEEEQRCDAHRRDRPVPT